MINLLYIMIMNFYMKTFFNILQNTKILKFQYTETRFEPY